MSFKLCLTAACSLATGVAFAGEITIVNWNAHNLLEPADVAARGEDLRNLARELKPTVLLLQEVASPQIVREIREILHRGNPALGFDRGHDYCTSFTEDPLDRELGVVSAIPVAAAVEFDQTPDHAAGQMPEAVLPNPALESIPTVGVARGLLRVRFDEPNLTVYTAHFKSSRGQSGPTDFANARQRELLAAALCARIIEDLVEHPDAAIVVGGDFNVGATDAKKNGTDLKRDDAGDGYDDTHAILERGLVRGVRLVNLTRHVGETYVPVNYMSGPIDNIFVYKPGTTITAEKPHPFTRGAASRNTFGSEHRPVMTTYQWSR